MTSEFRPMRGRLIACFAAAAIVLAGPTLSMAQVVGGPDVNASQKTGADTECAIGKNPTNPQQLFMSCNTSSPGLFAARSTDGGDTWTYPDATDKTIADGDAGQGAAACCDPTIAWDSFGNLYLTYLAALVGGSSPSVETLLSTDGGLTFTTIASFAGSQDQPTIVAANTTIPTAPVAVWIVWNQSGQMRASGAAVTALGAVGAFGAMQTIPGTNNCSFGDVAVSPNGVVVQACETPTGGQGPGNILVNIDTDGLGPGNFGAAITATATNVGGFDFIPPQNSRSVDAEAGLAYDSNAASPQFGRLYLVYTDEVVNEANDTDIMLRFSDNDGQNWSAPTRVNQDPAAPVRSQFLPRVATNPASGNIAVCWHDARNSATNTAMQVFCAVSTPASAVPSFVVEGQVGDAASTSTGGGVEFGDYSGMAYLTGGGPPGTNRYEHPVWADTSNSTGNNPNATGNFDAYTNWVAGGLSTNEGDPHIRTVGGIQYDFQAAGEFVSLRSFDGFEVQTRQRAIPTTFFPGPNPHTGLATCVSLNSAVAALVGKHRVTYQPPLKDEPEARRMELRVDGVETALLPEGVALAGGGRVVRSAVGGLEIEFPNGALLTATSAFWESQKKWYLNVDLSGTDAYEGIMGAIPASSWLPTLPDGSSLGAMPASLADRYAVLYHKFGDAWRVTDDSSLFDYAPGMSTKDFTLPDWPKDSAPCDLPNEKPAKPVERPVAEQACRALADKVRHENCVFDVEVTGEPGFAKTYLETERLERWATSTAVSLERERGGRPTAFLAWVVPRWREAEKPPIGAVQFYLHGKEVGEPLKLDESGRALWKPRQFDWENYRVSARYLPAPEPSYLPSASPDVAFPDRANTEVLQTK